MVGYKPEIVLVAAMDQNRVIGNKNDLPWGDEPVKGDLKHFMRLTKGYPIVMGRNTYESFPNGALSRRLNLVLSRQDDYLAKGAYVLPSIEEALESVEENYPFSTGINFNKIFVIGGGNIYVQAMQYADRLEITHVNRVVEGDTFFPEINSDIWHEAQRIDFGTHHFSKYLRVKNE